MSSLNFHWNLPTLHWKRQEVNRHFQFKKWLNKSKITWCQPLLHPNFMSLHIFLPALQIRWQKPSGSISENCKKKRIKAAISLQVLMTAFPERENPSASYNIPEEQEHESVVSENLNNVSIFLFWLCPPSWFLVEYSVLKASCASAVRWNGKKHLPNLLDPLEIATFTHWTP